MKRMILIAALLVAGTPAFSQFATIMSGPLSGNCTGGAPSLGVDSLNSIPYTCATAHVWQPSSTLIAQLPAQTAVTAVTTAQTMGSALLTAGFQNVVGRTLEICGAGIYTSAGTSTPTMTISLLDGGVTAMSVTTDALSATAVTNAPFRFCFTLATAAAGATGTLESHGWLAADIGSSTTAASTIYLDALAGLSSPINFTAANTLAFRVAASAALTSVQLRSLQVVALN